MDAGTARRDETRAGDGERIAIDYDDDTRTHQEQPYTTNAEHRKHTMYHRNDQSEKGGSISDGPVEITDGDDETLETRTGHGNVRRRSEDGHDNGRKMTDDPSETVDDPGENNTRCGASRNIRA